MQRRLISNVPFAILFINMVTCECLNCAAHIVWMAPAIIWLALCAFSNNAQNAQAFATLGHFRLGSSNRTSQHVLAFSLAHNSNSYRFQSIHFHCESTKGLCYAFLRFVLVCYLQYNYWFTKRSATLLTIALWITIFGNCTVC